VYALAIVGQRIGPLIGKLGSDHDGEVVAAARAIRRLLADQGLSFNDLARAVAPTETDGPVVVLRHWRCATQWIVDNPDWFPTDRERRFVVDMRIILKRHDQPTERQAAWIRSIVERLGGTMEEPR